MLTARPAESERPVAEINFYFFCKKTTIKHSQLTVLDEKRSQLNKINTTIIPVLRPGQ